ncbi:hypothetical protein CC86DRAFT_425578 [Ophiobolus disseminans]|uniref:Protein kinase domain-containing protein n=1 Tax=Ophiobolus disseminans TaxID=1469910 RepID=A0A6A6ZMX6_9PLEO|nr:hypothetical protein CC86DRAFT_425578 [Ophiobolus disseminans]
MSTARVFDSMPTGYTKLHMVGEGQNALVFKALPNVTISSAKIKFARGEADEAIDDALSKVVAIKIAKPGRSLLNEQKALEVFGSQAHVHPGGSNIVALLAANTRTTPHSLILSTLAMSCDTGTLVAYKSQCPWPIELAWYILVKMRDCLHFIQEKCKPRHYHGDLTAQNVIIGYKSSSQLDPDVKFVDFDMSYECPKTNDNWYLLTIMQGLAKKCVQKGTGSTYDDHLDLFLNRKLDNMDLEQIWRKVGMHAKNKILHLAETPEGIQMREILMGAIANGGRNGEGSGNVRGDVRKMLMHSGGGSGANH